MDSSPTGSPSEWLGCLVWTSSGLILHSDWTPFGAASLAQYKAAWSVNLSPKPTRSGLQHGPCATLHLSESGLFLIHLPPANSYAPRPASQTNPYPAPRLHTRRHYPKYRKRNSLCRPCQPTTRGSNTMLPVYRRLTRRDPKKHTSDCRTPVKPPVPMDESGIRPVSCSETGQCRGAW